MVRLEPVRSAEPPISSGSARRERLDRVLRGLARRDASRPSRRCAPTQRARVACASRPATRLHAALELARRARDAPARSARSASFHSRSQRRAALARVPACVDARRGISNGGVRPAERLARGGDLLLAQRRAVRRRRCPPCSARPCRSRVLQQISVGPVGRALAPARSRASTALDVVAVDVADHVPAVGLEALRRVVGEPAAATWPSIEMPLSS